MIILVSSDTCHFLDNKSKFFECMEDNMHYRKDDKYREWALQFAKIVFGRLVGFTPYVVMEQEEWMSQVSFSKLINTACTQEWKHPVQLPGYDVKLDEGNSYWIFKIPLPQTNKDIQRQPQRFQNGYRLIVEMNFNIMTKEWYVSGRYWYTLPSCKKWGVFACEENILLGLSAYPYHEYPDEISDREDMALLQGDDDGNLVYLVCNLNGGRRIIGNYNGETLTRTV